MSIFHPKLPDFFEIPGEFVSARPFGNGNINDTFLGVYRNGDRIQRYIHQRINTQVFTEPDALMQNAERVTRHLRSRMEEAGTADVDRRTLTLIPAVDGSRCWRDEEDNVWRTFRCIDNTTTHDTVSSPDLAYHAAKAFGTFQCLLADLPRPRLHETLPDFHNTRKRFDNLVAAIESDPHNRAAAVQPEVDFALGQEPIVDVLENLGLPVRTTHNDTKIANVLFDIDSGEGICVIDLDTTMPGLVAHDFGDLVRTAACPAAEDETDLSLMRLHLSLFEALVRGYVEAAGDVLTSAEISQLAFSGRLIAYEVGIRFLTDYLQGDTYFKTRRPGHNLDRTRAQFALARSIEAQQDAMQKCVEEVLNIEH